MGRNESKNLTEKSSYGDLRKAWDCVNDYGERATRAPFVKRAFSKMGAKTVYRRVNTPEKHRALYIIVERKRGQGFFMPILIVEGSEGRSFVALENEGDGVLTVLHGHAINRYIERHGWDGDLIDCENHILDSMWISSRDIDPITKEAVVYFDGGVFLGCIKDNLCHLNTYVANQHLYPNQRLKSRKLQDALDKFMEGL